MLNLYVTFRNDQKLECNRKRTNFFIYLDYDEIKFPEFNTIPKQMRNSNEKYAVKSTIDKNFENYVEISNKLQKKIVFVRFSH